MPLNPVSKRAPGFVVTFGLSVYQSAPAGVARLCAADISCVHFEKLITVICGQRDVIRDCRLSAETMQLLLLFSAAN